MHPCLSDFGAPASDSSLFIRAREMSLTQSLSVPRLRPGERYCLRTKPRCGRAGESQYLSVGNYLPCDPYVLEVTIDGTTYHWCTLRGLFVDPSGCQAPVATGVTLRGSRGCLACAVISGCRWFASRARRCCRAEKMCG